MQQPVLRPVPVLNKYELAEDFEYADERYDFVVRRFFRYDVDSIHK